MRSLWGAPADTKEEVRVSDRSNSPSSCSPCTARIAPSCSPTRGMWIRTVLASLGFQALATTSGGHAASLGRLDYGCKERRRSHTGRCSRLPWRFPSRPTSRTASPSSRAVSRQTIRMALEAGLAGCSMKDWSSDRGSLDIGLRPNASRPPPGGARGSETGGSHRRRGEAHPVGTPTSARRSRGCRPPGGPERTFETHAGSRSRRGVRE